MFWDGEAKVQQVSAFQNQASTQDALTNPWYSERCETPVLVSLWDTWRITPISLVVTRTDTRRFVLFCMKGTWKYPPQMFDETSALVAQLGFPLTIRGETSNLGIRVLGFESNSPETRTLFFSTNSPCGAHTQWAWDSIYLSWFLCTLSSTWDECLQRSINSYVVGWIESPAS